eukprot:1148650-Pelagomonas_calceolata.AAC.5
MECLVLSDCGLWVLAYHDAWPTLQLCLLTAFWTASLVDVHPCYFTLSTGYFFVSGGYGLLIKRVSKHNDKHWCVMTWRVHMQCLCLCRGCQAACGHGT